VTEEQKLMITGLRNNGIGYRTIANQLNISRDQVRYYCRRNNLTGTKGINKFHKDRELSFIKSLKSNNIGYEYIGGYKNNISSVTLRCNRCGEVVVRNASFVRKNRTHQRHECCTAKTKLISSLTKVLSNRCKQLMREQANKQRELLLNKVCIECGTEFKANTLKRIYCSDQCSNKRQNRIRELKRNKRLRQNGKIDYSITLTKLIKRDKGVCSICGRKVMLDVNCQHDLYPSIDHILPVSKGGTHTWGNVQLAHRVCNTVKSNGLIAVHLIHDSPLSPEYGVFNRDRAGDLGIIHR
jgi:5-methylcytosine-specific restriction endonuclease McrA